MGKYTFKVTGQGADSQPWETSGVVVNDTPGAFGAVPDTVLRETFFNLTEGKAAFGLPGVGCKGPYRIKSMLIEACD